MKKTLKVILSIITAAFVLSGCVSDNSAKPDTVLPTTTTAATQRDESALQTDNIQQPLTEPSVQPSEPDIPLSGPSIEELFATRQEVVDSPEWVTQLAAAQDGETEQIIVVASVDTTTATISMHELRDGRWQQLISTPGFIGRDGLDTEDNYGVTTPVGTFTIDKAFGIADNPGCQMEYTKIDDRYYWSGDPVNHFNELVSSDDVPDLDASRCEHLVDYQYEYQYALNMGYNSECSPDKGFAFFFHCIGIRRPFTGGCVAVPENIMRFIMQNIRPGCKITIDSLENLGGSLY